MAKSEILLLIPTYNERDNVRLIYEQIRKIDLGNDFLFVDDSSPDGTGDDAGFIGA